jgi:hypothetical protein
MKPAIANGFRVFLGAFLIGYALNQFFHFAPSSYGDMPETTRHFLDAVVMYLPFLYFLEILVGLLLLFDKWTPLVLLLLFPLSASFLMFNFINGDMSMMWPAFVVAISNLVLLLNKSKRYLQLLD